MTGSLLGITVPLAILTSALLLALGWAARAARRWWGAYFDDALTDNTRSHKTAVAVLYPALLATALWLIATDTIRRTRSSR